MDRRGAQNASGEHKGGRPVSALDAARANDCFEVFLNASTLKLILGTYRNICDLLHLKPNQLPLFYPRLKSNLTSWRAKALWKKFDARAGNKAYGKAKLCPNTRVLIIGAGPCGLRTAIEAQLLGAKVVVVEKRDRMSRNNVLHLWPFVIDDLRLLGAKKFFGKFCAGAIDHISIRQLQCVLLKVALLLGVEVHTEVSFERLIDPNPEEKTGWRAEFKPDDHPVSQFEFDVIIGADGKRNTLQGFKRKEFRGKLAIAITANFINKRTEAEARVEEISGVAFIFNQKFFKDLYADTGIDLENIVYYKDDTHYFVMTAKKPSLIDKGVIKQDLPDTAKLLAPDNVDREALMSYAREAAEFSTNYKMLDLEFAVNHYGQADVAMFDFTSMYAAENASKFIERHGYKLLTILVGDSLLEPFWPTGSGCARGFLSSLDAGWAIRAYGSGMLSPIEVIAERESIYRLLAQTTPENLNKDYKSYTLDPSTRYPNLNKNLLLPQQVVSLYDTDDPKSVERSRAQLSPPAGVTDVPKKRRRRESHVDPDTLLAWIKEQVKEHEDLEVNDVTTSFRDGRVLCAIIGHYRPDLLDYGAISFDEPAVNNQLAFDLLEKEIGIPPVMTGEEMVNSEVPDFLTMVSYLTLIYDTFRCEIPHIKHPKLELPEPKHNETAFTKNHPAIMKASHIAPVGGAQPPSAAAAVAVPPATVHRPSSRHKRHADVHLQTAVQAKTAATATADRKPRKRKTMEKLSLTNVEDRTRRLEEIAANRSDRHSKRRQQRKMQTDQFIKSMQMLQSNCKPDHSEPFEDYSIFLYRQTAPNFEDRVKDLEKKFTYVPDRENRMPIQSKGEKDEDFQARIKDIEEKWQESVVAEKKPKDLMRAIGKIDNSDWNIKEIEKKILENKMGKNVNKDKERVPKWSREQFLARQTKMEKQHLERQDSGQAKYAEIDKSIKQLDQKLKEGTVREINQQRIAKITEKLQTKADTEPKATPVQKNNSKNVVLPTQGNSESCHFCSKRVYLMERLSAEGRFFHRGCFRCQYCHTALRLGSYMFDRDGKYGYRFYCSQHFGMPGELKVNRVVRKPSVKNKENIPSSDKKLSGVAGVDLLDRVQTPERIEFSNLSMGHPTSDHEESLSQMDEDEWTDRNFGASAAEMGSSDDDSSSLSDTDSDDEEAYEEALEEPPTKEGTLKWAERYNRRYSRKRNDSESDEYSSSDQSSYYENSSGDDDSDTATEGEEEIRARELRKQEVRVEPPLHTDTGTDTEIASDETTTESSSEVHNSATEISTDSEFAHDDPTPTREVPSIVFNDAFVTKTRGKYSAPQKVQIKSTEIARPSATVAKTQSRDIELKFTPLVLTPIVRKPVQPLLIEGYALNRTQSTGGIATKVSLELKKKYLLGETASSNSIQKSGSASTLDSKLKSFHSTITDCQKLLKPATEAGGKPPLSPLFSPVKEVAKQEEVKAEPFENVNEGRPRSPVHETSIIVPQIDWSQQKQPAASSGGSSSCTSSSSSDSEVQLKKSPSVRAFNKIPRVEVQDVDLPPDSLNYDYVKLNESQPSSINEPPKSIASEKKALNPPKALPNLAGDVLLNQVHAVLHGRPKTDDQSGRSTPDSCVDQVTAVLTETELSDWARDGTVSDDLDDFDLNPKRAAKPKKKVDVVHVCGKSEPPLPPPLAECVNDILHPDLDNIEFMDTGTESSDDGGVVEVKNNGYVQFHDEDDIAEDSLSPAINVGVVEATNPKVRATFDDDDFDDLSTASKNTGYCIIENEKNHFGGEVIDLKPSDLEKLKEKRNLCENEEDSLLIIEPGTTTEENTCSDSTVKNVTQIVPDKEKTIAPPPPPLDNNNLLDKKRLEDKLAQVKKDMKKLNEQRKAEQIEEQNLRNNIEFEQHCQRLQSKVDFGNARDSIDVRKSRRQSKTGSPPKPDLILEEKEASPVRSRREQIEMERDLNKRLVQEMVMNKMRAQNKSLERKRRNRNSFSPSVSPCRPFDRMTGPTPDVLLSTIGVQKSQTVADFAVEPKAAPRARYSPTKIMARPLSVHAALVSRLGDKVEEGGGAAEALSLPDIHKALVMDQLETPKAPPRVRNEDAKKNVERLKEDARARARLMSDEALGLSPEDKLAKLRQRVNSRSGKENDVDVHIQDSIESLVVNTERRNSQLYANDTLNKKKNGSFRRSKSGEEYSAAAPYDKERTKSVNELNKPPLSVLQPKGAKSETRDKFHKSDPNLLSNLDKKDKKKSKDRERRKSITKMFTDLFAKKKESGASSPNGNRGFLARISPKARDKSKSCIDLHQRDSNVIKEEPPQRHMSFSELRRSVPGNVSPPPIPPLPLNYTGTKSRIDDSSDGESEWKRADKSSCDTLDRSGVQDSSSSNRRSGRSARKAARQSQLKRHRMAQEVQRKLEETEVKTRELEQRGVRLEKAIRGELEDVPKDETELLKEWFDLTRDMTEMRRYERELMIRAQELELEDRHARLQHELKDRLESDGQKTEEDFETEGSIIKEMMDIVRKRDSLVTLLEEDCRRYAEEDRGLEEMLAKGISLTPIQLKIADK